MENKTVAIIQARLTSSRFPNKVLQKIGKKTLIEILLNRLKNSKELDQIILAVPNNKKNKIIKEKIKVDNKIFLEVRMMFWIDILNQPKNLKLI